MKPVGTRNFGVLFAESTNTGLQPYMYNGKELDRMHALDWYDFGARHYDAALLRWHTMDPLCEKYYHISPYVFCGNNFVNAFDPNGREWDYITDKDGNIHIKLDVKLVIDASLTESQIEAYKSSINAAFNSVLSSIDGGKYSGEITFNGNVIEGQVTPILTLGGINDPLQGGQTKSFYSDVNLLDSKGNLRSSMDVGYDAVHELFHTARLDHPFESTQSADVELVKGGSSSYLTTSNTNENILFNIMNYPQTVINGKSYRSLNSSKPQGMMTEGQAQFLLNEINLQKKGAGLSTQDPYWFIFPGIPVK